MKRVTYVTVIVTPLDSPVRILLCNARGPCGKKFFTTTHGISGPQYRYCDEGITWARGWHTADAKALRAAEALHERRR